MRLIEAKRVYLEEKLRLCAEVVSLASKIATGDHSQDAKYFKKFDEYYHGQMAFVEKQLVTAKMVAFRDLVVSSSPAGDLKQASLTLAHACRDELANEWSPAWAR